MPCHLTSCHVTSRRVTSRIMSRHVTPRHVTSRHVTSRHATSAAIPLLLHVSELIYSHALDQCAVAPALIPSILFGRTFCVLSASTPVDPTQPHRAQNSSRRAQIEADTHLRGGCTSHCVGSRTWWRDHRPIAGRLETDLQCHPSVTASNTCAGDSPTRFCTVVSTHCKEAD